MQFAFYYPRAMIGDGGPTVAVWAWAGALAARGHQVTIIHAGGRDITPLQQPGVSTTYVRHVGTGRGLRPKGLGEYLAGCDVLVLNSAYVAHNLIAGHEARQTETPYVVLPHGAYDPQVRARRRALKRLWEIAEVGLLKKALGIHLFFESEVAGVARLAPQANYIIAPIGTTLPDDSWEGGGGYLAWLGRYDMEHKGIDLLLGALARIGPSARPRLVLHGRDHIHTRQDVEELAKRLGVGEAVEVRGPVTGPAKQEFLRQADGYVLPSRWDCYAIALVENLALGVPCLVSSGANISPSLRRAEAAIVVDPREESMARGLIELTQVGSELGQSGRRFVERELDWDLIIDSYVTQVSSLLHS